MHPFESVDLFVRALNLMDREHLSPDEVPESLRRSRDSHGFYAWEIRRVDFGAQVERLQKGLGMKLPPSFEYFISAYAFPAFQTEVMWHFANTGTNAEWELSGRVLGDDPMQRVLKANRYQQIGSPYAGHHDPICFDRNLPGNEPPLVQLDHEEILCRDRIVKVRTVAGSFIGLVADSLTRLGGRASR